MAKSKPSAQPQTKEKPAQTKEKPAQTKEKSAQSKEKPVQTKEKPVPARLRTLYFEQVRPALAKQLGRENPMSLPRLQKIVINMGVGSAKDDKKHLEDAVDAMTLIAGQKAVVTKARLSIAGFKLREGLAIGCKVTLRGARMFEFLDRLLSLALPRVRDFRGVNPKAFDGKGNYSLGLTEYLVFPELNPDKFTRSQGMNIVFVTSTPSDDEGRELLKLFGMPFRETRKPGAKG